MASLEDIVANYNEEEDPDYVPGTRALDIGFARVCAALWALTRDAQSKTRREAPRASGWLRARALEPRKGPPSGRASARPW
jgi:hypothetical protein